MDKSIRKLIIASLLILTCLLIGTVGFYLIEDFEILNAFYMAVITMSTVGFTEVHELTDKGRFFTAIYILLNLGVLAYAVSVLTSFILEGKLKSIYKNYMTDLKINKLKNHVIVCGYGRNGKEACDELRRSNEQFVVIEKNQEVFSELKENSEFPRVIGDATSDNALKLVGIDRAGVIIIATPSDADNVFITLTAREMKPDIKIIARASLPESESKLYRAGANNVILPDLLGGMFMAQMVTKPVVIEFLNLMTGFSGQHYHLEQLRYEDLKPIYQNKTLKELEIHKKTGGTVIGVKDDVKGLIPSPNSATLIGPDDTIVVLGGEETIKLLKDNFLNKA
ncbi:MAG: potassium channel protein [Saprospiraceae bacterium]|nr:potassium channel protein [Saprospiraceae bacterium]